MNTVIRNTFCLSRVSLISRSFSGTPVLETKEYRLERGLSRHKTAEGVLTDAPDYTYLDGRPTPLLHKQKLRVLKQRNYASQIVELCGELDFAKERYQNIQKAQEEERQRILSNRLKPKGQALKGSKKQKQKC